MAPLPGTFAVVRRGFWTPLLLAALFGSVLAALISPLTLLIGYPVGIAALVLLVARKYAQITAPTGARSARITPLADGLAIEPVWKKRLHVAPSTVAEGWVEPIADTAGVVLVRTNGDVLALHVDSQEEADAILACVHVAPNERVMKAWLAPPTASITIGDGLAALGAVVISPAIAFATAMTAGWLFHWSFVDLSTEAMAFVLATLIAFVALVRATTRRRVVIGSDGLVLQGALMSTSIRWEEVSEVRRTTFGLELECSNRKVHRLVTAHGVEVLPTDVSVIAALGAGARECVPLVLSEALFARIEAAARSGRGVSLSARLAVLDRGGRSLALHAESLRALATHNEHSAYREAGLTLDELEDVLRDPLVEPARRISAAYALSSADEPTCRARARIATESIADDSLRRAFADACEGHLREGYC